jgi:hypothetical protein
MDSSIASILAALNTSPLASNTTTSYPIQQEASQPNQPSISSAYNSTMTKELNKKIYTFPESYRLKGTENFDQWKQGLAIQFRALGLPKFITNPSITRALSDLDQAIILILL